LIWVTDGVLRDESELSGSIGDFEMLPAAMLLISVGKKRGLLEVDHSIARTASTNTLVGGTGFHESDALRHLDEIVSAFESVLRAGYD
jgi:hypothetical protein